MERRRQAIRDFVVLIGADLTPQGRRIQIRISRFAGIGRRVSVSPPQLFGGITIAALLEWTFMEEDPSSDISSQNVEGLAYPSGISVQVSPSLDLRHSQFLLLNQAKEFSLEK